MEKEKKNFDMALLEIIFSDILSTGDGLLTLIQVLRVMALENRSLDELAHLEPFPQVLVNVRVRSRPDVSDIPEIATAVAAAEKQLGKRGRVLISISSLVVSGSAEAAFPLPPNSFASLSKRTS